MCQAGHANFCITHGSRGVTVERSKVALAINQRVPKREVLRHSHDRVVNVRLAVWVILTYDVTTDASRLLIRCVVEVS